MSKGREIRYYDYVNHPYERVRDALRNDSLGVFQAATKAAAARAASLAAELHVDVGGLGIKSDIKISVRGAAEIPEKNRHGLPGPATRIELEWEAATLPRLFPLMKAELSLYPLTPTETQLHFLGFYEPPLGAVGKALDAVAGHRIAEGSVHRFVTDVAGYLRRSLA